MEKDKNLIFVIDGQEITGCSSIQEAQEEFINKFGGKHLTVIQLRDRIRKLIEDRVKGHIETIKSKNLSPIIFYDTEEISEGREFGVTTVKKFVDSAYDDEWGYNIYFRWLYSSSRIEQTAIRFNTNSNGRKIEIEIRHPELDDKKRYGIKNVTTVINSNGKREHLEVLSNIDSILEKIDDCINKSLKAWEQKYESAQQNSINEIKWAAKEHIEKTENLQKFLDKLKAENK